METLFLHEEILLLALRDDEGTIAPGTMYQYAVGGAILAELLLQKRINVDERRRKKYVDIVTTKPVGDPLIDECLQRVAQAKRRASLDTWVSRFAGVKNMKQRLAEQLCRRGILRVSEDKVLLLFTRKIYPEEDPIPERNIVDRLRNAIFTDVEDLDPRTVVLVSLADSANLLDIVFDKKQLKSRKQRIKRIVDGELTGKATRQAIEAVQAALMVACVIPALAATTVVSN